MQHDGDVIGIGSPLLDIIVEVDDEMLRALGFKKGNMHLIDKARSKDLLAHIRDHKKNYIPGGSAANTIAGLSLLGSRGAFVGMIGDDKHGDTYEEGTESCGVNAYLARHDEERTGHAITFITPDGERTFATHLGAAMYFRKPHARLRDVSKYKVLHIEGYQLEDKAIRAAVLHAMEFAKDHGVLVSLDLSDPSLVQRIDSVMRRAVRDWADIVFANEEEAEAFTGKRGDEALAVLGKVCDKVILKLGERGSKIYAQKKTFDIAPHPIEVKNTNGAGDAYAAGFLHGLMQGYHVEQAGNLASRFAAFVTASSEARVDEKYYQGLLF